MSPRERTVVPNGVVTVPRRVTPPAWQSAHDGGASSSSSLAMTSGKVGVALAGRGRRASAATTAARATARERRSEKRMDLREQAGHAELVASSGRNLLKDAVQTEIGVRSEEPRRRRPEPERRGVRGDAVVEHLAAHDRVD